MIVHLATNTATTLDTSLRHVTFSTSMKEAETFRNKAHVQGARLHYVFRLTSSAGSLIKRPKPGFSQEQAVEALLMDKQIIADGLDISTGNVEGIGCRFLLMFPASSNSIAS